MDERAAAVADGPNGPRERRGLGEAERPEQNHCVRPQSGPNGVPKHSYWLDLWLFILIDVVLFIFVYLLPCFIIADFLCGGKSESRRLNGGERWKGSSRF